MAKDINNANHNINKIAAYNVECMKEELSVAQKQLKAIQSEVNGLNEEIDKLDTNSIDYKKLETKIKHLTLQCGLFEDSIAEYQAGLLEFGEL